ncbi:MAG: YHS domain-containing protein [Chitinophagales bacterium]
MKKVLLIVVIACGLFSCNQGSPETKKAETNSPAPEETKINVKLTQLSSDVDHVCGMSITDDGINDTASYDGKLYGFCSKECKDEFVKDPGKYLPKN